MCRKMKLDHPLTPHTQINSKCIKDVNVRPKTIQIMEENIGSKISNIAYSNILSKMPPQTRKTKEKINKWTTKINKLKSFCTSKININKIRQPTEWENIFFNISDKGLISQIYKELIKLNTKITNNLF